MADNHAAAEVRAAGAVLWRPAGRGAQVALVHRPKYDDWTFPKGKLEPGEHVLLAASREVAEETGLIVTLGRRLSPVRYASGDAVKRVDYWAATVDAAPTGFSPNAEVDAVSWVSTTAAPGRLSYQRDAETLADFRAAPSRTVPLILVRHGSAGRKSAWRGSDEARPLDERGRKDAQVLAVLLRCFGAASKVLSSPAERCAATVAPYAAAVGVPVTTEPAFGAGGTAEGGAAAAAAKAAAELAASSEPAVICAHRENLPGLLRAACAELGAPGRETEIPTLRKGEFVVLHRSAGVLAAAEHYHGDGRD